MANCVNWEYFSQKMFADEADVLEVYHLPADRSYKYECEEKCQNQKYRIYHNCHKQSSLSLPLNLH